MMAWTRISMAWAAMTRHSSRQPFMANISALALAQVAIRVSRVAAVLVLTRWLGPTEFGAAAIVLTVYELVALFTRNGIAARVVQAGDAEVEAVARTAHWMTWGVCGTLVLFQAAIAVPVGWLFGNDRLALPVAAMGLIYLATPLCNLQSAFMQREGRLGRMALAGALQVAADNLLSAGFAVCGLGLWAIVLPKLLVAPIWVVMNRSGHAWRCTGGVSLRGWRPIARYSRTVLGIEALTTLQANVDTLMVGYLLGPAALGLYAFAFNAGLGISLGIVGSFAQAVFPHLCAARGDRAQLTRRFRHSLWTLACVVLPLITVQTALAPLYVPALFGEAWRPAVPVLMLICLSALPRPFAAATSQLLRAVDRPGIELVWQGWMTACLIVALAAGSQGGIAGVALAVLVTQAVFGALFTCLAPAPFIGALPVGAVAAAGRPGADPRSPGIGLSPVRGAPAG